jgi:hypothetical protein
MGGALGPLSPKTVAMILQKCGELMNVEAQALHNTDGNDIII